MEVLEVCFTLFFIGEILVKIKVFTIRIFLLGPDWYWSWFDILCVVLALVDLLTLTLLTSSAEPVVVTNSTSTGKDEAASEGSVAGILKMLKLARLGRIIRLLKFKRPGMNGAEWKDEFSTVPDAMFTNFRCFTDGCADLDGRPLQERLRRVDGGGLFMFSYILLFLFVTIGIFNLIMAVFIDNVADGSTKKRQRELGENAPRTEYVLATSLRHLILTNIFHNETKDLTEEERTRILNEKLEKLREMYGYMPHTAQEYEQLADEIRSEMLQRKVVVTQDQFNRWLSSEKDLITKLEDAEIDLSCKSDLFEVLDADLSGELEFDEMVDGLLKCRGPVSKTDIISIRLKTDLLVKMMSQVCEKLGIEDDD
ncbi:CACNA1C [Symbiodinium pilosum]|uniref:CACNA1C protein n=1 Tax=Symbiodinium pilosum TaxID=2952 RepID=A0A812VTG8_SYMPI|nr:CACNA1C [Symbiodinium pilosum]